MQERSQKSHDKHTHAGARFALPRRARRFLRALYQPREDVNPESGQAIVLVAFMMVALLAILGLAIDGGGLFFLYRDTQNATDAAVVAATYARCTSDDADVVEFAGYQAAARNGFHNDSVGNWVTVNNPPSAGTGAGDSRYVEVEITSVKPPYFIQLVYRDPLTVTARAVGRCSPPFNPATVPGLWGGSRTCNNTVNWTGASGTISGGVHSNNEIMSGGGGQGNTVGGPVTAVSSVDQSNGGNTTWPDSYSVGPQYDQDDPLAEHFPITDFAPGGTYARRAEAEGLYTSIASSADDPDMGNNGTWDPRNGRVLEGLYYVDGDVRVGSGVNFGTRGITIVATGEISFSGGVNMYYYMDGFLLYSGYQASNCGDNAIRISGSSGYWYGVIYAPGGGVNVSASNMQITGSILADTIDFSGSTLNLTADPDILPPFPANVVVSE